MKKIALLLFVVVIFVASCQSQSKEEKIQKINDTYKEVEKGIDGFVRTDILYEDPESHWMNANYTAFAKDGKVVKLQEETGEEGFGSTVSFYFKDEKVVFMLIQSVDPEENEEEKSIYFAEGKIIQALTKQKASDNTTEMDKIKNVEDKELLNDIAKSTKTYLDMANTAMSQYKTAMANSK